MDFQTIILNNFLPQERARDVIRHTASLIASARATGVPVIYVSVEFRKDTPKSAKTTLFSRRLKIMGFL